METRGKITNISMAYPSRNAVVSFEITAKPEECEKYIGKDLDVDFSQHYDRRAMNANRLLWACLGDIAMATGRDKWTEYLELLKDHGKFTYILVKPQAVEMMQKVWRESEVIGELDHKGEKAVQMLCYFGSSTYNQKEFSVLLDAVVEKMKDLGLDLPPTERMQKALEEWGKYNDAKRNDT